MRCSFDQNLLHDYLENTIEPLEKIILLEHLKVCKECRQELTELKLLYWEFNSLPDIDLPIETMSVKESVINKIKKDQIKDNDKYSFKNYISTQSSALESASIFLRFIPGTTIASNLLDSVSTTFVKKRKIFTMRGIL